MALPKLRKLYSPYLILACFIADFLLVVWLLVSVRETAHTILAGAAVVMGVLGLMLFNRMAVQTV